MQALLPPSLVISATPLPQAGPPAPARATTNNEASFSRQLEQTRQARAQQSARPVSPEPAPKPPAPPPPAANASARNAQGDSAQRNEATRASARAAAARKGDAPPPKAESSAAEPPSEAADNDPSQTTPAGASELLALLGPAPEHASLPLEPAQAGASSATLSLADPAGAAVSAAGAPDAATTAKPAALPQALPNDAAGHAAAPAETLASPRLEAALALPAQPAARDSRGAAGTDSTAVTPGTEPTRWQQAQVAALAENNPFAREGLDTRRGERATPLDSTDRGLAALGPTGAASPGTNTSKAADVAQASLAAPATSAEFRAALGAQVSLFARAGVQQAELHLNPAELGPVSIQIVLDGQQAQVNFGADSPQTRQIIEAGMPELAGALRDAGLTLTGGGVSQHAGGQRQDGNGSGSAGGHPSNVQSGTASDGTTDAQVEQLRRSAVRVAQGGVDFYA